MMTVTPALHLLVAASLAAPAVDPSACAADDLRCSARASTAAARRARSDEERVEYLYFASRAYLALSEQASASPARSRELCQAQRLIDQAIALPATELRGRILRSSQETRARLKEWKIGCRPPKGRANDETPQVARAEPPEALEAPAKLLPVRSAEGNTGAARAAAEPTSQAETPGQTRVEDPRTAVGPMPGAVLGPQATQTSRPLEAAPAGPPPGRRLLISGGVAMVVGLGLTGIAGSSGARASAARRTGFTRSELAATPDNLDKDVALRADYERRSAVAVATGITGGVTLIAAVVMLCVGARRKGRAAESGPMLLPIRAGVLFSAKF